MRRSRTSLRCALIALALAAHGGAHCAQLGRLFFSSGERAQLDAVRRAPKAAPAAIKPSAPIAPDTNREPASVIVVAPREGNQPRVPRHEPVMTGFVERSSGTNTVWLNNEARHTQGGYGELDPREVGKARRN